MHASAFPAAAFLCLVTAGAVLAEDGTVTASEPAGEPTSAATGRTVAATSGDVGALVGSGPALIFQDDFETGGDPSWYRYQFSHVSPDPQMLFDACDLPVGTYTFRLDVDNGGGGHSLIYPLEVVEIINAACGTTGICKRFLWGEPTIDFR